MSLSAKCSKISLISLDKTFQTASITMEINPGFSER